ncbi:unnamed protein product [Kluyveromyces dobzhanskii CBS 2104]|uniref:WGS project CCBQ000000000 data, contig 00099 n=1 Tax=Kluyveromyces dobzhanskii CBS 2104 TaxID=1427455 RepID=A0A0A8L4J0_9SACH|nr:unnamed protein product [Kluyveromyces dobzhanskii CBS 2104]
MRSIPQPRQSRYNTLRRLIGKFHNCVTFKRLKRRWNLHKLKKSSRNTGQRSAIPLDRIANLPTGMSHKSSNMKPLLLVSFNKGQEHSPRVRVLETNGHLRCWISGRKFSMKRIVNNASVKKDPQHSTSHTVRQEVVKNADLKINYSQQGILKTVDIPRCYTDDPKLINIGQEHTLRIRDYPSLNPSQRTARNTAKRPQNPDPLSRFFFEEAAETLA